MSKRTIIECDGCPKVWTGNPAIGYSPGGWTEIPDPLCGTNLCPECGRAVANFIRNMKRDGTSPGGSLPGLG